VGSVPEGAGCAGLEVGGRNDYGGKVNLYRWCPVGICPYDGSGHKPDSTGHDSLGPVLLVRGRALSMVAADSVDWTLNLFTVAGRDIGPGETRNWRSGNWSTTLDAPTGIVVFARLVSKSRGESKTKWRTLVVL